MKSRHASTAAKVINSISLLTEHEQLASLLAIRELRKTIPGWSNDGHAVFFSAALRALGPHVRALVCGVYHGLDLALIQSAARQNGTLLELTGVDLFSDAPCADWTPAQRERGSWQANGFGQPPSIAAAQSNAPGAKVVKANSIEFLRNSDKLYDLIYLDTSHDYETVSAEVLAARSILAPNGILAGDDFAPENDSWGVDRAVAEMAPHHAVLWNRIWIAT